MIAIVGITAFNSKDGINPMDSNGAPAAYCNDPAGGNNTCAASGCHTGAPVGNLTGLITSNMAPSGYACGNTYTITADIVRAGHSTFGFEISPQNLSGTKLGTMAILNNETKIISANKYITHTNSGNSGSGGKTWSFQWTAPATGQGPVTFYGAFNAANSDNAKTGDSIFTSTLTVNENMTAVQDLDDVNFSFSMFPNPAADNLNVKFNLPESSFVEINLLDINGNGIMVLFAGKETGGEINKRFNISSLSNGVYLLNIKTKKESFVRKIIKIK